MTIQFEEVDWGSLQPLHRDDATSSKNVRVVPFALEGFEMEPFTASNGRAHDVYRTGTGPAVIVIHDIPGITPRRWVWPQNRCTRDDGRTSGSLWHTR